MTKLQSFGCSFTWGSELSDEGPVHSRHKSIRASNMTWPALLAKHLNLEYQCQAWPGSGNLKILHSVLKKLETDPNDLFVINWSWIDRYDYFSLHTDSLRSPMQNWHTLLPGQNTLQANFYYKHLHSQYRDKLTNLIYVSTAITALQQHHTRFVMTNLDDLLFETQWHCDGVITALQSQVKKHIVDFEGYNFLSWSQRQGYAITAQGHPLEQAHRAAFEYLVTHNLIYTK